MFTKIDPFECLVGKVVQNSVGTFWFNFIGNDIHDYSHYKLTKVVWPKVPHDVSINFYFKEYVNSINLPHKIVKEINPFDIVSGKSCIVGGRIYTFNGPGNNMDKDGWPIWGHLNRIIFDNGLVLHYKNGNISSQTEL